MERVQAERAKRSARDARESAFVTKYVKRKECVEFVGNKNITAKRVCNCGLDEKEHKYPKYMTYVASYVT